MPNNQKRRTKKADKIKRDNAENQKQSRNNYKDIDAERHPEEQIYSTDNFIKDYTKNSTTN